MGDNHDVTATSDRTSRRRRNGDPAEAPARFQVNCRMLADAIAKIGTGLRIALTAETDTEPFLIHASYDFRSRMRVYGEAETERAITSGLEAAGSTCREFLEEAAEAGRRLATPRSRCPVVWDEPGLVTAGIAPEPRAGGDADWKTPIRGVETRERRTLAGRRGRGRSWQRPGVFRILGLTTRCQTRFGAGRTRTASGRIRSRTYNERYADRRPLRHAAAPHRRAPDRRDGSDRRGVARRHALGVVLPGEPAHAG